MAYNFFTDTPSQSGIEPLDDFVGGGFDFIESRICASDIYKRAADEGKDIHIQNGEYERSVLLRCDTAVWIMDYDYWVAIGGK